MKVLIIVFVLFLSSLALASPILNFQHNQTQPGETIIATIKTTGEFAKQISPSDITFYDGRRQIPFEFNIVFYNGTYYFYIYTTRVGNFSVHISDILYKEDGNLKSYTIIKPFSVANKIIADEKTNKMSILSIKPGFVFTAGIPEIKLINVGTAVLNLTYGKNKTSLSPSESKEIVLNPKNYFSYFNISTYEKFSIPVICLYSVKSIIRNSTIEQTKNKSELKYKPKLLVAELVVDNETSKSVELFNFGDDNITNIKTTTDISFAKVKKIIDMHGRGVQNLTIVFKADKSGYFRGHINITYTQNEKKNFISIPMSLFVVPEKTNSTVSFNVSGKTCSEISGVVCEDGEICDAKATFTESGEYCCLSKCQPTKKSGNSAGYGWIVGIIILLSISALGYYIYNKQRKLKPKKPADKLKEISEKFGKRMSGGDTNRINDGLANA